MILYINLVTKNIHFAICDDKKIIEEIYFESNNHLINSFICFEKIKNSSYFNKINEIILINGPGGYTGIRIGAIIAQRIADFLNVPVRQLNILESIYKITNSESYVNFGKNKYWKYDGENIEIIESLDNLNKKIDVLKLIYKTNEIEKSSCDKIKTNYMREAM